MRRLRFSAAMSLDGYIAGPLGEYDWIVQDPAFDFVALWNQFDTLLMGRRTFEVALTRFSSIDQFGKRVVVVSTTLDAARFPGATFIRSAIPEAVAALKAEEGKDIWLFGGAALFRTLLDAGLVDTAELAVIPILLGGGVKVVPEGRRSPLHLKECTSSSSGIVRLSYSMGS